jgi:hypothetical protein
MLNFLLAIPHFVLYGCGLLIAVAIVMAIALSWRARRARSQVTVLANALKTFGEDTPLKRRNGLSLATLDEIRSRCEALDQIPAAMWTAIDVHVEQYTSPEEVEGWFLTDKPRDVLPYEIVIGKHFHSAIFSSFPGLLTGAGLTLTFVAILLALYGVHYDKANTVDPISGIDTLINGLSGKFLSSIVALVLSILFTLYEKSIVRGLRNRYEHMIAAVSQAIPHLSRSRILLDIQRFAAKQTVSVSREFPVSMHDRA